jgi:Kef-type K+ transport system membrane component KefB
MTFSPSETMHLLGALIALLCCAHGAGYVFRRLRLPPVFGEILGGLVLGPTLLGALLPGVQAALFGGAPTQTVLGAIYQLGLLLLMFCSGTEIRPRFEAGERRAVMFVTASSTLLPFLLGFLALRLVDVPAHLGPAGSAAAFGIVFAIAVAITSIPVIARILMDLRILETPFARIVLSTAVIEDVILYVLLAIALSLVGLAHAEPFGLARVLGIEGGSAAGLAYYAAASAGFLAVSLAVGHRVYRLIYHSRYNLLRRSSPLAHMLIFLLLMTCAALFLGIAPMFGAFLAGIAARGDDEKAGPPREAIRTFSFAFFIPIYFAIVGYKLDLRAGFDPWFFAGFLLFATLVKMLSVFAGARMAGTGARGSLNLAVALNARGGPGIVLASLAYDAGIIDQGFYATLILVVIATSLAAGAWLDRAVRRGGDLLHPLR